MKRAILASLAAAALLGLGVPGRTLAATPNVGAHIHVEVANHPTDRHPIPRAPWTFQVKVILHDQPGMVRYLRVDDSSTPRKKIALALGPCSDCDSGVFPFTIDFSSWSVGRHELRWHADVLAPGSKRQFTTSRSQVCIQACSPNRSGRATPFNGGGGWYTNNEYATGHMLSPETSVRPGGSIIWQAAQDAVNACAFLNPDFHHGSSGTNLGCWSGQANHTVLIPASAQPGDRLVLYASDGSSDGSSGGSSGGSNAGLLRLLVGDGTDRATATYEYQSWWAKDKLVLP